MDYPQKRNKPRFKVKVPVEVYVEGADHPIRGATSDLSLDGCYVETMFNFKVGQFLELKLQLEGTLLILARVVTSDPLVGNGFQFVKILPEDIEELGAFLDAVAAQEAAEGENKA
ncbi:MAG TPA: PilZ domain-containing protein [Terriglobales bacterium]|jgi:hypothetical protein|nr:PilZ domain-containing protein [Terriglobales bacterium]